MSLITATLRLALLLLAGALPAYALLAGRVAVGPVALVLLAAGLLGWYEWGHLSLPRAPLPDSQGELGNWLQTFANLVGARLRRVTVVEAEAGCLEVPEALNREGEVVYARGDLGAQGLSHHLAQAARQLAVMAAPPPWSWRGMLATGLGLGAILGLQARYPHSVAAALLAVAAALGL
ncbi:MAG: hypothetical protein HUU35_12570, partial [Armatimonadetes bacterium]|nr:hypothetical protein [Armatimonadota bacterium]